MIVTGIRDLGRFEPRGKPTEAYIEEARWLLGSMAPLIVFTDPEYQRALASLRPAAAQTWWRPERNEVPHDPRLEAALRRSRYAWNPLKDTPRYLALMRQKLTWLRRGSEIAEGPVTWVDLALRPRSPTLTAECLLGGPSERIRLAELSYVPTAVRHDRAAFYADHYWPVAGGVIQGTPAALAWLDAQVETEWQWCLANGYAATDEMMLGFIRFQHPERFEAYYADHPTLVDNWGGVRDSLPLIMQMALRAQDDGNAAEAQSRFDAVASARRGS